MWLIFFTALTWKRGTPGLQVMLNLRLFFRVFSLDLLERMLASVRFLLPGGLSNEGPSIHWWGNGALEKSAVMLTSLAWLGPQSSSLHSSLSRLLKSMATLHVNTPASFLYQVSSSRKPGPLLFIDTPKDAVIGGGHTSPLLQPLLAYTVRCRQVPIENGLE